MTSTPAIAELTLLQLRCFAVIVEQGSFAAAGRQLGMSTSAVSKTISRLEKVGSIRLLNRSTHALSLTPEGERLLPSVREALGRIDSVEAAMQDVATRGAGGKVRISAPIAFLSACLIPLAARFRAEHPDIVLEFRASDAMDDLADEGIDLALRAGPISGIPGHLRQSWFQFSWVTCASPDYLAARETPMTLDDLAYHDLIAFRNQGTGLIEPWRYRTPTGSGGRAIRRDPTPMLIVNEGNAIRAAGVAGMGIIWTPKWNAIQAIEAGHLRPILTDLIPHRMDITILRRAQEHTAPRIALVIAFLQRNARLFS
jgi:DNA-binding transcriptional LysR family regulator